MVTAEAFWEASTSSPALESNSGDGILHLLPDIPEENIPILQDSLKASVTAVSKSIKHAVGMTPAGVLGTLRALEPPPHPWRRH